MFIREMEDAYRDIRRLRQLQRRGIRRVRQLRDSSNPFEQYDDDEFVDRFRFWKETFQILHDMARQQRVTPNYDAETPYNVEIFSNWFDAACCWRHFRSNCIYSLLYYKQNSTSTCESQRKANHFPDENTERDIMTGRNAAIIAMRWNAICDRP